ncbi:MAG: very short patch repair endonuclease [Brevundimonas subvibrioides]|uniref:Very short patch repair endonuclease n=1 Tax=Brevundimonas subvibrioides TaxID=74313 RepID=A0A258HFK4_9CAUL|nr:very short patch repair endonuclease [Brevundimonas subvibrioides]OYX55761.1 MAG: very short patch repair endonuclease [Brevundimonas subvibrioides]
MADVVDPATRSRMMAGIKAKNTKPEMVVRQGLHRAGFRFRTHVGGLPGKPDLVLAKWRAVVFVHGCFWHRHAGCRFSTHPRTREDFWQRKFAGNVERDARSHDALLTAGWRVATVWECAIRSHPVECLEQLRRWIVSEEITTSIG